MGIPQDTNAFKEQLTVGKLAEQSLTMFMKNATLSVVQLMYMIKRMVIKRRGFKYFRNIMHKGLELEQYPILTDDMIIKVCMRVLCSTLIHILDKTENSLTDEDRGFAVICRDVCKFIIRLDITEELDNMMVFYSGPESEKLSTRKEILSLKQIDTHSQAKGVIKTLQSTMEAFIYDAVNVGVLYYNFTLVVDEPKQTKLFGQK